MYWLLLSKCEVQVFPVLNVVALTPNVVEGNGFTSTECRYEARLSGTISADLTITYGLAWDTSWTGALAELDDFYGPTTGQVVLSASSRTATFSVNIRGDNSFEPNESFFFLIYASNSIVDVFYDGTKTTIMNDDPEVPPAVIDVSQAEIVDEGELLRFAVTRKGDPSESVTLSYHLQSGTADLGSDFGYSSVSHVVSFAAGQALAYIDVQTRDDGATDGRQVETLSVVIDAIAAGSAVLGQAVAEGFINDIDLGPAVPEKLRGGKKADTIHGFGADDVILGKKGDDSLFGDKGNDVLSGGKGSDSLFGGQGSDQLSGGKGSDLLDGGSGNDFMFGGKGDDYLLGGSGHDSISGGKGNDVLVGGRGYDVLEGGKGRDFFVFDSLDDSGTGPGTRDVVADFYESNDRIDLSSIDAVTGTIANETFVFIGSAQFSGAGQLRAAAEGNHYVVSLNTDANANTAEMSFEVHLTFGTLNYFTFIL